MQFIQRLCEEVSTLVVFSHLRKFFNGSAKATSRLLSELVILI